MAVYKKVETTRGPVTKCVQKDDGKSGVLDLAIYTQPRAGDAGKQPQPKRERSKELER